MLAVTGKDGRGRAHGERGAHLCGLLPLTGRPEVERTLLLELTGLLVEALATSMWRNSSRRWSSSGSVSYSETDFKAIGSPVAGSSMSFLSSCRTERPEAFPPKASPPPAPARGKMGRKKNRLSPRRFSYPPPPLVRRPVVSPLAPRRIRPFAPKYTRANASLRKFLPPRCRKRALASASRCSAGWRSPGISPLGEIAPGRPPAQADESAARGLDRLGGGDWLNPDSSRPVRATARSSWHRTSVRYRLGRTTAEAGDPAALVASVVGS